MTAPTRSRFRSVLRWTPPVVLALVLLGSWSLFLSGGMAAVIGWGLLISTGQLPAPLSLLVLAVHAVRKRRFSRPMSATLVLALFALWPALWGFGLLTFAFPYSLEDSEPSATVRLPSNEPLRVFWGGDRLATNYHAVSPDQRWAYDLVVEPAAHGSSLRAVRRLRLLRDVRRGLAVPSPGHVHHATDRGSGTPVPPRRRETRRGSSATTGGTRPATPSSGGRLRLGRPGRTLIIAHLKPRSLQVETGQLVASTTGERGRSAGRLRQLGQHERAAHPHPPSTPGPAGLPSAHCGGPAALLPRPRRRPPCPRADSSTAGGLRRRDRPDRSRRAARGGHALTAGGTVGGPQRVSCASRGQSAGNNSTRREIRRGRGSPQSVNSTSRQSRTTVFDFGADPYLCPLTGPPRRVGWPTRSPRTTTAKCAPSLASPRAWAPPSPGTLGDANDGGCAAPQGAHSARSASVRVMRRPSPCSGPASPCR